MAAERVISVGMERARLSRLIGAMNVPLTSLIREQRSGPIDLRPPSPCPSVLHCEQEINILRLDSTDKSHR